jgi:hypothetical protein
VIQMPNPENFCGNKECNRWVQLGTGSHTLNSTQTDYCSIYCRLYTEQGLKKIAVPDKLGRNNMRFPPIERCCDSCGKTIYLKWNDHFSNRCFCNQECHFKMRRDKSVRKPELRYQILRLMRDNPQKVWNVHEIADMLDKSNARYRVNWRVISQILRILSSAVNCIEPSVYELKPEAYEGPLLRFVTKNGA